ncbi:MAG: DUF721 domain-containing protein [Actinomycetota bacterium]
MGVESLDNVLKKVITELDVGNKLTISAIFNHWEEIVGEQISEKSKPRRFREGTLYVSCANSTWANELDLMSGRLVKRINSYLGCDLVKGVRFKPDID